MDLRVVHQNAAQLSGIFFSKSTDTRLVHKLVGTSFCFACQICAHLQFFGKIKTNASRLYLHSTDTDWFIFFHSELEGHFGEGGKLFIQILLALTELWMNCTHAMTCKHLDDLAEELIILGIFSNAAQENHGVWTGNLDTSR